MGRYDALINKAPDISGSLLASVDAAQIAAFGSDVLLGDGETVKKALFKVDQREVQKFVNPDAMLLSRGKVVAVFIFDGSVYPDMIGGGDRLTASWNGTVWIVELPMYPNLVAGVVTNVAVLAYPP